MALLTVLIGAAALVALVGIPSTGVSADSFPTPIPTKMSDTLVAVAVSRPTVNPGDTFDLTITIKTDTPTWGLQLAIQFDPKLVQIDSNYDTGGFYNDYAKAHSGTFLLFPTPKIDNNAGTISVLGESVVGVPAGSGGPSGQGVLITFHGTAKAGAQGTALFKLSNIIVSDNGDATGVTQALGGVMSQAGVLAVGSSSPAPTQAPQPALAPVTGGSAATLEPTVVKLTSLDPTGANSSGGSIPWVLILPVVIVVIGGGAFVILRKK